MARKVTYDQEKVKELRASLIEDSLTVFSERPADIKKVDKWSQYRKDLLMKYAPRVLPTLHAGNEDDKPLVLQIDDAFIRSSKAKRGK